MNELQTIEELSGMKQNSCTCEKCASMCRRAPCLGTPADILKIAEAGHADKIRRIIWTAGQKYGLPPIRMYQLKYDSQKKQCVFFHQDRCRLHASGLKPTEGKVIDCKVKEIIFPQMPPNFAVALTWLLEEHNPVIDKIKMLTTAEPSN